MPRGRRSTPKKLIKKCKRCKQEYDKLELIRQLGEWANPVLTGYCSSGCWTLSTIAMQQDIPLKGI